LEIGVAPACRLVGLEDHNVCPGLGLDGHALDSYHVKLDARYVDHVLTSDQKPLPRGLWSLPMISPATDRDHQLWPRIQTGRGHCR